MEVTNKLIQKIEEVKNEGITYRDFNKYKSKKEQIENSFLPSFKSTYNDFQNLIVTYNCLKEITNVDIDLNLIKQNIEELKLKVESSQYDKSKLYTLSSSITSANKILETTWDKYISEKTSAIVEILKPLDKLITGRPEKLELQKQMHIISTSAIGSEKAVDAIEDYIAIYENLMTKLKLKENVLDFLKKIATGIPVSIKDMDDEVYEWLKTSDFANKITLNIM